MRCDAILGVESPAALEARSQTDENVTMSEFWLLDDMESWLQNLDSFENWLLDPTGRTVSPESLEVETGPRMVSESWLVDSMELPGWAGGLHMETGLKMVQLEV